MAGCATVPPEMSFEDRVASVSTMDLCEAVFFAPPDIADATRAEAARRGIRCEDYLQAVTMVRSQREATRAAADAAPRPYYRLPQPARQTSCTSYSIGGAIRTDCR